MLTIAFISFSLLSGFANNNPIDEKNVLVEAISFAMSNEAVNDFSISVSYDQQDEALNIMTGVKVNFIQVMDKEGNIEYQLPLFSDNITLDLNDFTEGSYSLNFLFDNEQIVSSSFSK